MTTVLRGDRRHRRTAKGKTDSLMPDKPTKCELPDDALDLDDAQDLLPTLSWLRRDGRSDIVRVVMIRNRWPAATALCALAASFVSLGCSSSAGPGVAASHGGGGGAAQAGAAGNIGGAGYRRRHAGTSGYAGETGARALPGLLEQAMEVAAALAVGRGAPRREAGEQRAAEA